MSSGCPALLDYERPTGRSHSYGIKYITVGYRRGYKNILVGGRHRHVQTGSRRLTLAPNRIGVACNRDGDPRLCALQLDQTNAATELIIALPAACMTSQEITGMLVPAHHSLCSCLLWTDEAPSRLWIGFLVKSRPKARKLGGRALRGVLLLTAL